MTTKSKRRRKNALELVENTMEIGQTLTSRAVMRVLVEKYGSGNTRIPATPFVLGRYLSDDCRFVRVKVSGKYNVDAWRRIA